MGQRALIILMKPHLRKEFAERLKELNAKTNKEILSALREFIKEKGIKASYIKQGESKNTGGEDEKDNPHSGSPLLN
jgi:hypothetical protein